MSGRYVETTEELCLKLRQMKLSGMPIRNWGQVYGELAIMYEDRLPD